MNLLFCVVSKNWDSKSKNNKKGLRDSSPEPFVS